MATSLADAEAIFQRACASVTHDLDEAACAIAELADTRWGRMEAAVLARVVSRRRAQPDGSWLAAFLGAWRDVGSPHRFRWVKRGGVEEFVASVAQALSEAGLPGVHDLLSAETNSPLTAIALACWKPEVATHIAAAAVERADAPTSVPDALWLLAILDGRFPDEVAGRVLTARAALLERLVEQRPGDFIIRAASILEPGHRETTALTDEEVEALLAAATSSTNALEVGDVYGWLVHARSAATPPARMAAFSDAVAMKPDVLMELSMRGRASLHSLCPGRRTRMLEMLDRCSSRLVTAHSCVERLGALFLRECVYRETQDPRANEAEAALQHLRRLVTDNRRFPLEWPVDPLLVEVTDASAYDEVRLLEQTLPPKRTMT